MSIYELKSTMYLLLLNFISIFISYKLWMLFTNANTNINAYTYVSLETTKKKKIDNS